MGRQEGDGSEDRRRCKMNEGRQDKDRGIVGETTAIQDDHHFTKTQFRWEGANSVLV